MEQTNTGYDAETSFTLEDGRVKLILKIGDVMLSMEPDAARTLGMLLLDSAVRTTIGQRIYDQHPDPVRAREALEEFGQILEDDDVEPEH